MQKKLLSYISFLAVVGALLLAVVITISTSTVEAAGSGVFCDPPYQNTEVPLETGTTKEAFCKGVAAGSREILCADGTIVPLDAGITPADFCAGTPPTGHGGLANPATGTGGTGGAGGNCTNTSFAQGGDMEACGLGPAVNDPVIQGVDTCGGSENSVRIGFEIGCKGEGNAIMDMVLALLRFITTGVGVLVIGSVIVAGIQYSAARGNPQATQAAIKRIQTSIGALLLYIFAFALINWIIPGTVLK